MPSGPGSDREPGFRVLETAAARARRPARNRLDQPGRTTIDHPPNFSIGAAAPETLLDAATCREAAGHPVLARWRENVGGPVALDLACPAPRDVTAIDVVSWNVAIGMGRLDRLVRRLDRPFVLLLQEAYRADESVPRRPTNGAHGRPLRRAGRQDVVEFARDHGLSLRYVPSMRNGPDASDRGNAVLSSAALGRAHAFTLPFARQRRVVVAAELDGFQGLVFASAHLDVPGPGGWRWPRNLTDGRLAQADALGAGLDAPGTVVLGGDLNTLFGSRDAALSRLKARGFRPPIQERRWRRTFRGPVPLLLDHVLVSPGSGDVVSIQAERLDDGRRGRVFGSDHHPLLARIRLVANRDPAHML